MEGGRGVWGRGGEEGEGRVGGSDGGRDVERKAGGSEGGRRSGGRLVERYGTKLWPIVPRLPKFIFSCFVNNPLQMKLLLTRCQP